MEVGLRFRPPLVRSTNCAYRGKLSLFILAARLIPLGLGTLVIGASGILVLVPGILLGLVLLF